MVTDDLLHHEVEELLGEVGVQPGVLGQLAQAGDLGLLPGRIRRRQVMSRLINPHSLRTLEAFRQQMDQCGIKIIDAVSQSQQFRVAHGAITIGTAALIR